MGFRSFKDDGREANDDPAYDDEVKENQGQEEATFRLADHWYAALMTAGLSKFLIFNLKYNVFPEWVTSSPQSRTSRQACFALLRVEVHADQVGAGNFLLVMVAGVFSTMA